MGVGGRVVSKRTHTREDQRQRTEFFEQGKRLDANPETRALAGCWICGLRIDYEQAPGTTTDSPTLDHYYPVEDYPELQNGQLPPRAFRLQQQPRQGRP